MDAHTLELLEFDKVRALLAEYAASSLGKDLATQLEPLHDVGEASRELKLVSEMTEALGKGQAPPFGGLSDVRMLVRRAAIGTMLDAEQLLQVAEAMHCTGAIYRYRMCVDGQFAGLIDLLEPVPDLGPVAKTLQGCIDGRGNVLDSASRELAETRRKLAAIDSRIQDELKKMLRDPKIRDILRYPNYTVSGDHYVLPVSANHRQKVPGTVHRTSGTGETLFIEPSGVTTMAAEKSVLKGDEEREIRRILRRLSKEVGRVSMQFNVALEVIAQLDLITAKARLSLDYKMDAPEMNNRGRLWLRNARHPLLLHLFKQENKFKEKEDHKEVVPIEVHLGVAFDMLIITGPNTGGKTVTLKTAGLLSLMAMCGMHIPASAGSTVPMFKHILADIGDEQSIEQSLSTFSSHISRIAEILQKADKNSLILLDELGAGTDPTEGAALGRAILDQLNHLNCRAIVTTHLGDLKTYAFSNDAAENGAVEFDVETLRPTYRLYIGQFGASNALKIARRLKLPKRLIDQAHKYLRRKSGKSQELTRIQDLRIDAEKARSDARAAQAEADKQREEFEKKKQEIERQAEAERQLKQMRQNLRPNERVKVARFDEPGRVVRVDLKKHTAQVSVGIGQWEVSLEEIFPWEDQAAD